jgi:hypothetical protein
MHLIVWAKNKQRHPSDGLFVKHVLLSCLNVFFVDQVNDVWIDREMMEKRHPLELESKGAKDVQWTLLNNFHLVIFAHYIFPKERISLGMTKDQFVMAINTEEPWRILVNLLGIPKKWGVQIRIIVQPFLFVMIREHERNVIFQIYEGVRLKYVIKASFFYF